MVAFYCVVIDAASSMCFVSHIIDIEKFDQRDLFISIQILCSFVQLKLVLQQLYLFFANSADRIPIFTEGSVVQMYFIAKTCSDVSPAIFIVRICPCS